MGDGFWNPADYVSNRYESGSELQKGKTLFGNTFTKNYSKIPQEAQDYINEQIQKRIDSGYKLTKWFLRALENHVKVNWPDQVPYNWDISSFISSDKGMANAINKQNGSKRVGNTQEQVANAKPGDTVLYNGESVALSGNDIDKAQQNTGVSASASAHDPKTYADKQAQLEEEGKANADARASLTEASKPTEKEAALRENAQKALDEKNAQRQQDWQNQQAKNQEQNAKDAEQVKQVQTSTKQSVMDKSVNDANKEKWDALQQNAQNVQREQNWQDSQPKNREQDSAAKDIALKQQSAAINQNTIDEINQGSTNVGDLATAVSKVSMPTMNAEARPENLVVDERLKPVESMLPPGGIDSLKLNKNNKSSIAGGKFGQNKKNLVAWINNRDKYPEGSADWIRCNDNAKEYAKAVIALAEPWEANND